MIIRAAKLRKGSAQMVAILCGRVRRLERQLAQSVQHSLLEAKIWAAHGNKSPAELIAALKAA